MSKTINKDLWSRVITPPTAQLRFNHQFPGDILDWKKYTVLCRSNESEFRDISPLFDENQRFLERNEISPNFRRIFESAINCLDTFEISKLYANVPSKIRTTIRDDSRNFEGNVSKF